MLAFFISRKNQFVDITTMENVYRRAQSVHFIADSLLIIVFDSP